MSCHAGGWSSIDVPTGWVQVLRGPRPPSEVALSSTTRSATSEPSAAFRRTRAVQPCSTDTWSPDASGECARAKIAKLEKALEVMGECQGPAVEALKAELERTRDAAKPPPINVEVEECRKFIQRSEKRIQELDAERAAEAVALKEVKDRLQRLEVEQAQQPDCAPSLGSRDLFRSTEVAGIGCPVAVPTCAGCRSNTK